MSSSSIEAAESYFPESGIAPSRSGLEVFNHILFANKLAANLKDAKKVQNKMSQDEIRSILYAQGPDVLLQSSYDARKHQGLVHTRWI